MFPYNFEQEWITTIVDYTCIIVELYMIPVTHINVLITIISSRSMGKLHTTSVKDLPASGQEDKTRTDCKNTRIFRATCRTKYEALFKMTLN